MCQAIYKALQPEFLVVPHTESEWINIAKNFETLWQYPMCVGALDGKHIKISPPPASSSHYYNYKGDFSVVLLALVDAHLQFIYVDVGTNGRISDGGVWHKSTFKQSLDANLLHIPAAGVLPNTKERVPCVIVADDAFPLTNSIMKPYPGKSLNEKKRIFNYRLSRARRVSENAFGNFSCQIQSSKHQS